MNNRAILTSILVFMLMAASWLLAGEVYAAERAIWVWGAAKDIVLDTAGTGAKKDFFDFCTAPFGDATKKITLVFFDAKPYGVNLMDSTNAPKLRQFLSEAHAKSPKINVEFLSGDKLWATPDYRSQGESLIDEVINFNDPAHTTANQRFDGIHYDVEPYLLDSKSGNDPLDWNYDQSFIWSTYLAFLTNCQAKINTYNAANDPDIRFGVAIPRWYSIGGVIGPEGVIDRVDYIAIMDYKDNALDIINGAQDEINYAATKGKKVYVGVEASHPTDNIDFPPSTTFYEEGNATMETVLTQVNGAFSGYSIYAGIAIHYYEELTQPTGAKGYEASYRRLWTSSFLGHVPVVAVVSPNRSGEIIYIGANAVYIQWEATDLDGDSLTIDLQYSSDGGTTWTNIATGLANTGSYAWDTTGRTAGSNYLIKVIATDSSGNHLVGYDVSNKAFSISNSVTMTDITDLHVWNESSSSLRLKWTPPNCTPRFYKIYRSVNGVAFSSTPTYDNVIVLNKYIDTGLSASDKYRYKIKAVYGNGSIGNDSNVSNMLIPGNTFLVDYFEQNEGITYNKYGATLSDPYPSFNATYKQEGSTSLKLDYTYGGGWGAVSKGTFHIKVDISPYNAVKFWAKGGTVGKNSIKFQLGEFNRTEGNEIWESPALPISNIDWFEYQFNFSDFIRVDVQDDAGNPLDSATHGNNRIDTHSIKSYGLVFSSNTANGTYNVDEIKLLSVGVNPTISIPQTSYTFGTIGGTIDNRRFVLVPIPVTYGGFNLPWTIRIWTNNGTGVDQAGLKGADGVVYIPLKVWCQNYGPTASVPNEENDYFWGGYDFGDGTNVGRQYQDGNKSSWYTSGTFDETYWGFDINGDGDATDVITASLTNKIGEEPFWLRVVEDDEMVPTNKFTWRRLCWNGAEIGNPFNIYLAIDVQGKKNQQYQTTTLTLEYINE